MTVMQELKQHIKNMVDNGGDMDLLCVIGMIEMEYIPKEKQQLISFGYSQIQHIDAEIGDLIYNKVPEEIYNETFKS